MVSYQQSSRYTKIIDVRCALFNQQRKSSFFVLSLWFVQFQMSELKDERAKSENCSIIVDWPLLKPRKLVRSWNSLSPLIVIRTGINFGYPNNKFISLT